MGALDAANWAKHNPTTPYNNSFPTYIDEQWKMNRMREEDKKVENSKVIKGDSPDSFNLTVTVPATPPYMPSPPPPPPTVKVKSATPEIILWDDATIPMEMLSNLTLENIGGQELLSLSRHDRVSGENVSNQLIKNLTFFNQEYSSKKILGLQNTSDKYFSNFSIKLESKIPFEGNGPGGTNVYLDPTTKDLVIDLINLESDEIIEIQVGAGGTIYTITVGVEESW